MKVKLLKKIRKQYSIVYYPNGLKFKWYIYPSGRYVLHKKWRSVSSDRSYSTKQQALNAILYEVRRDYSSYKGIKVWHNA